MTVWLLALAMAAAPSPGPLVEGLTVTTAIAGEQGDYESRKRVLARDGDGWRIGYSADVPDGTGVRGVSGERIVHDADLASARIYRSRFEDGVDEDYPGTTALGASADVLRELRDTGRSRFALVGEDLQLAQASANPASPTSLVALASVLMAGPPPTFRGELVRHSRGTLDVVLDGRPVALPVLVARGRFTARDGKAFDAELSLLDDETNPLALAWRMGRSTLRVVRIDRPATAALAGKPPALAETLARERRVTLPGLYFDFGRAQLRPESAATLPALRDAIAATDGPLVIEGHTDAIGDDAANLALSQARADAVLAALVALDPSLRPRLSARGFGETRPQAGNDTLEGRARNRRVDLVQP